MPHRMPECMPDKMSDAMPECMPDSMAESMPDRMSESMSNRRLGFLSDRIPEFMPDTASENVMVGIPRSEIFFVFSGRVWLGCFLTGGGVGWVCFLGLRKDWGSVCYGCFSGFKGI